MPERGDGQQESLERWRGSVSADLQHLREDVTTFHHTMSVEHGELKRYISDNLEKLSARIRPLEILQYVVYGFLLALIIVVPTVWIYAGKLNAVLERVEKVLGPDDLQRLPPKGPVK